MQTNELGRVIRSKMAAHCVSHAFMQFRDVLSLSEDRLAHPARDETAFWRLLNYKNDLAQLYSPLTP